MNADGLRTRRANYFVQVDQGVARNANLSYRALGLLTYLLSLPDGWDVRSEVLSRGEGREGREAIRTTLRELGANGHYRLERRRTLDGRNVMGTAISEMPVPEWIAEFKEFSGKAIPVVQQPDGSWLVRHLDGTLTGDGFPGAGLPDSGFSGPLSKREREDSKKTPSLRSESARLSLVQNAPGGPESGSQVPEGQQALIEAPGPAPARPGYRFEDFWKAYPRKEGKKAAQAAWARATKATDTEVILTGLARSLAHWQEKRTETRFIPHPTTWLNQGRWDDQHEAQGMTTMGYPEGWY